MDPLSPQPPPPPSSTSQNTPPTNAFGSSEPGVPAKPRTSHKKPFIIIGVILALLIISGTGLSIWAIQNRNAQLARHAKIAAEQKAKDAREAKAREGTVADLELSLEAELEQIQEVNDRSIFNLSDRLKQEADGASSIGTGNENGL